MMPNKLTIVMHILAYFLLVVISATYYVPNSRKLYKPYEISSISILVV